MYAMVATFAPAFEKNIWQLWGSLKAQGLSHYAYEKEGHQPHLTLASFEEGDMEELETRLRTFLQDVSPFQVTFPALGSFLGTSMVTLNPVKTPELTCFHTDLHQEISDIFTKDSVYSPQNWFPHLTLANRIDPASFPRVYAECCTYPFVQEAMVKSVKCIHIEDQKVDTCFKVFLKP